MSAEQQDKDEIQKLLELASSGPADEPYIELNEAERFALSCGVTSGETRVLFLQVYLAYYNWSDKPLQMLPFAHQFRKLFHQIKRDHSRYYLLNPEPFDLTADTYFKVRKQLRETRQDRQRRGREKNEKK